MSSVPERVVGLKHEHAGTATGLMLTIAAVGGYFIPRIFGHLVPKHGYTYGWTMLAIISAAFALVGLVARNAKRKTAGEIVTAPTGELISQPQASTGVNATQ